MTPVGLAQVIDIQCRGPILANTAAVISEMQTDRCRPLLQTNPKATSTRRPGWNMLVRFSEKVFDACPDILDEPLHVAVPTHASHVDHVGAKVA